VCVCVCVCVLSQGCNLSDNPDVPCDPQEACTVGDKTPPGVMI